MSAKAATIQAELAGVADPARAASSARFFKTGPGEYAEGDVFIGVTVPVMRRIARQYRDTSLAQVGELLSSPVHEHRCTGFLILALAFERADEADRARIFAFCRAHLHCANNWDLVDLVAPKILGPYLHDNPQHRPMLYELARSANLWERRTAIVATLAFIRQGSLDDTLAIAETLLDDKEDLIHKAAGWMLRELGIRDLGRLDTFLDRHAGRMPRTMLRYALEKHSPTRRKAYMSMR